MNVRNLVLRGLGQSLATLTWRGLPIQVTWHMGGRSDGDVERRKEREKNLMIFFQAPR